MSAARAVLSRNPTELSTKPARAAATSFAELSAARHGRCAQPAEIIDRCALVVVAALEFRANYEPVEPPVVAGETTRRQTVGIERGFAAIRRDARPIAASERAEIG